MNRSLSIVFYTECASKEPIDIDNYYHASYVEFCMHEHVDEQRHTRACTHGWNHICTGTGTYRSLPRTQGTAPFWL